MKSALKHVPQWTVFSKISHLTTSQKVTAAAVSMIVLQTILRGWVTGHSWFYSDDYLFLSDIGHGDDNFAWYFRFHFSHFMPLSFVLVKFVTLFGAFNWTAAAIQIIVMQVLVALTCWWMLRTLFGNRPGILIPLAFVLFSPMTLAANTWCESAWDSWRALLGRDGIVVPSC